MKSLSTSWVFLAFLLVINLLVAGCGTNLSARDDDSDDPGEEQEQVVHPDPIDEPRNSVIVDDVLYVLARDFLYIYELREGGRILSESDDGVVEMTTESEFKEEIIDLKVDYSGILSLTKTSMVGSATIANKGNYLYLGGERISIVDISNKFEPRLIRSLLYTEQDEYTTMFVPGDGRCYVAPGEDAGFDRWSACNVPQVGGYAAEVYHYKATQYLHISGDYLIASGSNSKGAILFNVTDPTRPQFVSSFGKETGFGGTAVLYDEFIYRVGRNHTMHIYHRLESATELPKVARIAMNFKAENALVTRGYLIISGTKPADAVAKAKTAIVVYSLADPINPIDVSYIQLSGPFYGKGIELFGECIAVSRFGYRTLITKNKTAIELISIGAITESLAFDTELEDLSLGTVHGGSTMSKNTPYTITMNERYLFAGGDTYVLAKNEYLDWVDGKYVKQAFAENNPCFSKAE